MTWLNFLEVVIVSWGVSTINSFVMEYYHARRAMDEMGDHDEGLE